MPHVSLKRASSPCKLAGLVLLRSPARAATSTHTKLQHMARFQAYNYSSQNYKIPASTPSPQSKPPATHSENPAFPSFNLFHEVRNARPAVRYTVYAGLGLMATVESTFWFNVMKAKFFPSASDEESNEAAELLASIRGAVAGYKAVWMTNYGNYYGGYVWGVGER